MNHDPQSIAESEILMDYLPKLIRLAERNMSVRLKTKVGSDDMAGSIIGSVIRMSREGKLRIEQSESFWKVLVAIALNKVRKKARYYGAQKRCLDRELRISDEWPALEQLAQSAGEPSDDEGRAVGEALELLAERLDDDCRVVLSGRIENKSNLEIAAMLGPAGKSSKTVTRCWKKIETEINKIAEEGGLHW